MTTLSEHAVANGWALHPVKKASNGETVHLWANIGGPICEVFRDLERLCDSYISWPLEGKNLTYREAYIRLNAHRASISSTFGYPRYGGCSAIYRLPNGSKIMLSNGSHNDNGLIWEIATMQESGTKAEPHEVQL